MTIKKSKKFYSKIFFFIIGILILYFLFKNVDFSLFYNNLKEIDFIWYVLIIFCFVLLYIVKAMRLSLIEAEQNKIYYLITPIHGFLNRIFPFGSGELSIPIMLKKYKNIKISKGIGYMLFLRYIDMLTILSLFSTFVIIFKPNLFDNTITTLILVLNILLVIGILSLVHIVKYVIKFLDKINIKIIQNIIKKILKEVSNVFEGMPYRDYFYFIIKLLCLTILSWIIIYFIYSIYLRMFHLYIPFFNVIIAATIVAVIANLPINSFGRLGTFELSWTTGFLLVGITNKIITPIGLFINISNIVITGIIAFFSILLLELLFNRE